MFKLVLEKAEEPEIKLPTSVELSKKQESSRKTSTYFCFIDCVKAFDCVDGNKLWKILKEMRLPDQLICLLWNLYASQEAPVKTGHGTMDWFKIWKEYIKAVYCHSCLFNFFAEYIMGIAQLDKSQAENKITKRNVNNLRYADDTTLIAESEEELKGPLIGVKEESEKLT